VRRRRPFIPLTSFGLTMAVLLGVGTGLGGFTFHYAEGLSYFSTDPAACANCHIMNDQLHSWSKAGHHHVAGCVDCHLPPAGIAKYMAKAANGYHHSRAFTLQDFHEPIQITPGNADILQENCLRCHGDLVHDLVAGSRTEDTDVRCVHCHRRVGHGMER
jgi:cytochrome c nitrite reductase small subunit